MDILSVRYNTKRNKKFQIKTIIFEENKKKAVKKEALNEAAKSHIKNMYLNYKLLEHSSFKLVEPILEKDTIIFPFIDGVSFDSILLKDVIEKNRDEFFNKIYWYKTLLEKEEVVDFVQSENFINIFGNHSSLSVKKAIKIPNIDLNFDNLLITNEEIIVIDYEWVFNFPLPINFILYRSILVFINKYSLYFENFMKKEEIFNELEITNSEIHIYNEMEKKFMTMVGLNNFKSNYLKQNNTSVFSEYLQDYSSALNNSEDYIQLFWDSGNGFNEKESIKYLVGKTKEMQEFVFKIPDLSLKAIRIDPVNSIGIITIHEVVLVNETGSLVGNMIENLQVNNGLKKICINSAENDNIFLSINTDPQFIYYLNENSEIKDLNVRIVMQYSRIYDEYQENMLVELIENNLQKKINFQLEMNEKLALNYNETLNELEKNHKEILVKKDQLLDEYLKNNEKIINENNGMKNSLSWKITEPLRKIKKFFK
ncbi:hypothetical protein AEA09_17870 [Lysinibacillus contaminans]|uniref:Uncharacterized protein n=1 Tax=Lysinibacillus contaminans TaxID=1293441 RepID=A0ABR5JWS7_9BACI|nr:hypothetical protein [Lysinibacillus contaminans]KOS66606.1 hypothetical protein AEA09_17870 [Lysinibacillus contaminans]